MPGFYFIGLGLVKICTALMALMIWELSFASNKESWPFNFTFFLYFFSSFKLHHMLFWYSLLYWIFYFTRLSSSKQRSSPAQETFLLLQAQETDNCSHWINFWTFSSWSFTCVTFIKKLYQGGHSIVKNTGGWLDSLGSGILVGKDILGFFKNIDLDNS